VQHHAAAAHGIVEPVSDLLLTVAAAAPGLGRLLRTGEDADQRRQGAEEDLPAGIVPGLAPLVLRTGRVAGPPKSDVAAWHHSSWTSCTPSG
jgi:hypothetical protein